MFWRLNDAQQKRQAKALGKYILEELTKGRVPSPDQLHQLRVAFDDYLQSVYADEEWTPA